jgi:hypothetical protein
MLISVQLIELNPLNNIHPRGPIKRPNKARQQKVLNGNANKVKYILLSSKFWPLTDFALLLPKAVHFTSGFIFCPLH